MKMNVIRTKIIDACTADYKKRHFRGHVPCIISDPPPIAFTGDNKFKNYIFSLLKYFIRACTVWGDPNISIQKMVYLFCI